MDSASQWPAIANRINLINLPHLNMNIRGGYRRAKTPRKITGGGGNYSKK